MPDPTPYAITPYGTEPSRIVIGWFRVVQGERLVAIVCGEEFAQRMLRWLNEQPTPPPTEVARP